MNRDSLTFPLSVRLAKAFTYLLEGRKRCWGLTGVGWGGADSFRLPGSRVRGGPPAAGGRTGGAGRTGPRHPQAALPRVPCRSCPVRPPQSRRRSGTWGPGGAVAQRLGRLKRPPRRPRLRRARPPAAPRSSRRKLRPRPRFPGPAWLRRLEGRWASAPAAETAAPSGVRGFAAEPCRGGGSRLSDDPRAMERR